MLRIPRRPLIPSGFLGIPRVFEITRFCCRSLPHIPLIAAGCWCAFWCACSAIFDTDSLVRLRQKNTRQRAVRLGDDPDRRLVFQAVPRRTISILALRAAWLSEETAFHNQLYAPTLDGPRKRSRTLKKHAAAGWVDISARSRTISSSFELNQQRTKPRGQERAD